VADTGPGVPAADRERIFDRLVRLDEARGRDHGGSGLGGSGQGGSGQGGSRQGGSRQGGSRLGGSGLGLAIARGIARAHGGELRCDADSVFELTLPVVAAPAEPGEPG